MKTTTLYTDTIKDLRHCYDTHAKKFSSTRKKTDQKLIMLYNYYLNKKKKFESL